MLHTVKLKHEIIPYTKTFFVKENQIFSIINILNKNDIFFRYFLLKLSGNIKVLRGKFVIKKVSSAKVPFFLKKKLEIGPLTE